MANIQKRGGYTPRRVKEQRAFRLVVAGSVSGLGGAVLLIAAIVGASTAVPAIVLLLVAAACVFMFRGMTS